MKKCGIILLAPRSFHSYNMSVESSVCAITVFTGRSNLQQHLQIKEEPYY